MMYASSFAISYVMEPLLDTIGMRGCQLCVFWGGHKTLGDNTCWVHVMGGLVSESSCLFDVPKCLCEFVCEFVGGDFVDDPVGCWCLSKGKVPCLSSPACP